MDPAWIKSKRRQKKNEPGKISGQFRKKLSNNPFAEALMTPLRYCHNTEALLPRYFLQDLELVEHPEHPDERYIAPGPLSTDSVIPVYESGPWSPTGQAHTNPNPVKPKPKQSAANEPASETENTEVDTWRTSGGSVVERPKERRRQSPVTVYCLSRKRLLDSAANKAKVNNRLRARILSPRSGSATAQYNAMDAIWNPEMGNLILKQQRRTVVDALVHRASRNRKSEMKFMQPVQSWDGVKDVEKRGCVLWFTDKVDPAADAFATFDVKDAKWWRKMPVHNLTWLLGDDEVKRLRDSSPIFMDNDIVVLKLWRSESMRKLHLLLWRMQGYLAEQRKLTPANDEEMDQ